MLTKIKNSKSFIELNILLSNEKISSYSLFKNSVWILDTEPDIFTLYFNLTKKRKLENTKLILFWKTILYLVFSGKTEKRVRNKGKVRIYYVLSYLFDFLDEINFFEEVFIFTPEICNKFIYKLKKHQSESEHKKNLLTSVTLLYQLNKYMPVFFQVSTDPLQGRTPISIFPVKTSDDEKGWKPIPMNNALYLLREAISYIEDYANDIINVYEEWNKYYGLYPEVVRFKAFGREYSNSQGRSETTSLKLGEITYKKIKKVEKNHPFFEIWNHVDDIKNNRINITQARRLIIRKQAQYAIRNLYASCLIIILFSTGMRKSELYSLKRGCISNMMDEDIPFIKNKVFKVNIDNNEIPISNKGRDAVDILEKIAYIKTYEKEGPLLIPLGLSKKELKLNKSPHNGDFMEKLIEKFCHYIGWDSIKGPHLHQFRHTLASAVWERTEQAPVLLMILYNHSSLSMTLKYLRRNPYIKKAQRELFRSKYKGLVNQILQFSKDKKITGPGAKKVEKLIDYVTKKEDFLGKTEHELGIELEELFMTLIEQDQIRLFLTPVCVCIRYNTSISKSPCMQVEDHGDDAYYSRLPRTDRCVGGNCKDALFTPLHEDIINQSMNFYDNYIDNLPADKKENVLFTYIAKNESKKYKKVINND